MAEPIGATGFGTIVCGIDSSLQSLQAVRQALVLGEEDATLWGVSAWDSSQAFQAGIHMAEARKALRDEARASLQRLGEVLPEIKPMLVQGKEVAALLAAASNLEADLICVGASGLSRPAGILFGSVATAMAHHAPCSVLIARDDPRFPAVILHANDGSPESLIAGRHAGRIAARYDSTLITLHVSDDDSAAAEKIGEIASVGGVEPVRKVEKGSPPRRIVEVADQENASLIVMGSRGRTGLAALGNVSERVAHHAECSVLIARPPSHPEFEEGTLP